jgi:uncharacterized membrane protein
MRVATEALVERFRRSLFVVPMLFVLAGVVLAEASIVVDERIGTGAQDLPLGFTSTVESARSVLSTVAGATITVAGIAFSVSLLTIQLASSQYSPRVVSGLFRDPVNKRIIGIVVGTFTYCLIVLRSVRAPLEQQGDPVIPNVSVAVGVILGIVSILAVIAFIDHNAHAMDISKILDVVTDDAIDAVERNWSTEVFEPREPQAPDRVPDGNGFQVRFDRNGWVQLIDLEALIRVAPAGGTIRIDTAVGRYAICGSPFCTVWPEPRDVDEAVRDARRALHVGETRTLQQDVSYGIRQLADVALRALSPGVNDPTTAQDAIFHLVAVLRQAFEREEPVRDLRHDHCRIVLAEAGGHAELLVLAFDEIRRAAAPHPAVAIYMLEAMALLQESLPPERAASRTLVDGQARLVLESVRCSDLSPHDRQAVERIHARHFVGRVAS